MTIREVSVTCRGCGQTVVLPNSGRSTAYAELSRMDGWVLGLDAKWRCPECDGKARADD